MLWVLDPEAPGIENSGFGVLYSVRSSSTLGIGNSGFGELYGVSESGFCMLWTLRLTPQTGPKPMFPVYSPNFTWSC